METILVNRKWHTERLPVLSLTENQQWALQTHRRYLDEAQPVIAELGLQQEGETAFFRGQPETHFVLPQSAVRVIFTGLSHWQVFRNGSQTKGTREVKNLAGVVRKAAGKES